MKAASKQILFLLLFPLLSTGAYAQAISKVTGRTTDAQSKVVEFSSVSLLKAADSTLVKGALGDVNGNFEIEQVPAGAYLISVSSLAYKRLFTPVFTVAEGQAEVRLGDLRLADAAHQLAEVKVTATKPLIEQQIDRIVVNVENSIVSAGNTALEVLEKSPGVYVDKDGAISLKGKANVLVMINDKPTYVSSSDLAVMLKNMQASQVEKIEIMTNPPAKYDAAGNAGIINIKTKKNQNMGLNGSWNAGTRLGFFTRANGQAVNYVKENAGLNLNYREGKVNLFGSLSADNGKSPQTQQITRRFGKADQVETNFNQLSEKTLESRLVNYKAGADFFLTDKTVVGVLFNGMASNGGQQYNSDTRIAYPAAGLDTAVYTKGDLDNKWLNNALNLNFKHVLDSTGQEITADLDYALFNNSSEQQYRTNKYDERSILRQIRNEDGNTGSDIYIGSGKLDYTRPLPNKAKLEAGVKASWVTSQNDMQFFFLNNEAQQPTLDPRRTRDFEYRERIQAAYVSYAKEWNKVSVQLGLRAENTNGQGTLQGARLLKRNYTNLFPSVFVSKPLNEKNQLVFSYSRRIDRPNYEDLNPFLYFLDPYTYNRGNEYLRPQFTNAFELSHTYNNNITTTINYSRTKDVITDFLEQDALTKTTYLTELNIGLQENYGISVSVPVPVTKWWTSNTYFNAFHNRYAGDVPRQGRNELGAEYTYMQHLSTSVTTWTVNSVHQFSLPKGFAAELSGNYRSRFLQESQLFGQPMGAVSVGLQKKLLNNRATLKLNVSDVFWTNYFRGNFQFNDIDVSVLNKRESRQARLTFTYRFGNSKVAAARSRRTGLEEERGRIKTSN
ncbi:TonB-dependent receptor [Hymenobacter aquaticus]|uniref:TonB-dependent receptor n=1 Tax=Hymenobacter aquaticus TaxID=1867101 RepID=A0A4Z0PUS4_9BACT|nr:outer membrane beta-barrel family protein [Hymenobacter aquaticus]TGE21488.1 TonB-dependent receptor [Hymenobacter aquaticus]